MQDLHLQVELVHEVLIVKRSPDCLYIFHDFHEFWVGLKERKKETTKERKNGKVANEDEEKDKHTSSEWRRGKGNTFCFAYMSNQMSVNSLRINSIFCYPKRVFADESSSSNRLGFKSQCFFLKLKGGGGGVVKKSSFCWFCRVRLDSAKEKSLRLTFLRAATSFLFISLI